LTSSQLAIPTVRQSVIPTQLYNICAELSNARRDRQGHALRITRSGWRTHATDAYEGTMTKGGEVRRDCECYEDDYNGLTAE